MITAREERRSGGMLSKGVARQRKIRTAHGSEASSHPRGSDVRRAAAIDSRSPKTARQANGFHGMYARDQPLLQKEHVVLNVQLETAGGALCWKAVVVLVLFPPVLMAVSMAHAKKKLRVTSQLVKVRIEDSSCRPSARDRLEAACNTHLRLYVRPRQCYGRDSRLHEWSHRSEATRAMLDDRVIETAETSEGGRYCGWGYYAIRPRNCEYAPSLRFIPGRQQRNHYPA